ncbi:serine carboxypeptidase-like 45 isoform X2 [Cryptomeria japonica]|uniref:serine carboxypeptidase-like 45 isoform X2 n=1 Tax=Cryptomeria japonica TaxID=3369 RepID=UPI0025AD89FE|nr:serine carboxypeptidase-like 45 isoform X2 [Cryptomeria japonica]
MDTMSFTMHVPRGQTCELKVTVTILALLFIKVLSAPQSDLVDSLPGQPPVPFKQYAGYVTVDQRSDRALFYYFVEAETEPDLKPLVLWLNGGPGCSSFGVGAFSENGPFQPKGDKLVRNGYSWNKEANVLYLESPAGVGFSYSSDQSYYVGVNDTLTANDNLLFLLGWFKKFPEYKTRELYLTGESYAGHYIPQLADLIVRANRKQKVFNLKGVAIGNPLLDFYTDFNARAEYYWSHGLISDPTYKMMITDCNYTRYVDEYYRGSVSNTCEQIHAIVDMEVSRYVDRYDVTLDVCITSLLMQSKLLRAQGNRARIETKRVEPDVCVQDEATTYLNRPEVQKAFHARLTGGVSSWQACSDVLQYDHLNLEIPTTGLLGKLVDAGIRVLIYSGDQDSVIPLIGSRTLITNLASDMQLNTTVPYRVWFEGKQVAGWTQEYSNILSFATVRGAAHEVPFSQPERSLVLLKAFLSGQPLPTNF